MLPKLVGGSSQALGTTLWGSLRVHHVVQGMLGAPLIPGQHTQVYEICQTQQGHCDKEGEGAHEGRWLDGQADEGAFGWDLVGQAEHVAERPGYAAVPHLWSRGDGSLLGLDLRPRLYPQDTPWSPSWDTPRNCGLRRSTDLPKFRNCRDWSRTLVIMTTKAWVPNLPHCRELILTASSQPA